MVLTKTELKKLIKRHCDALESPSVDRKRLESTFSGVELSKIKKLITYANACLSEIRSAVSKGNAKGIRGLLIELGDTGDSISELAGKLEKEGMRQKLI